MIQAAPSLPQSTGEIDTVLLTGATGFLGRYLALEWLERFAQAKGTLVCLVRASDDIEARKRLDDTFDTGDAALLRRYRDLAAAHLEVLAADKSLPSLGLPPHAWQRLTDTVDLIVDCAAAVNHILPYRQLFGPNVIGTAELLKIALTTKAKPVCFTSTVGLAVGLPPGTLSENTDIRQIISSRPVSDSYANGYANSKWAGEVLLADAHERCGLPVSVFRCGMILSAPCHAGQVNVSDMFTRLLFSLVATGIAPDSFYPAGLNGSRRRAHYDGMRVDFVAEAIAALGAQRVSGHRTFNMLNQVDDGIGFDTFVDWLIEAGYPIARVPGYGDWFQRFTAALQALPERQRRRSLLPLIGSYQRPMLAHRGDVVPATRFAAAVRDAGIAGGCIPGITKDMIVKYIADLHLLDILGDIQIRRPEFT
ncbi:hypothetical protein A5669_04965 [Mycolicibacterium fortuitum]|uniref:thioester reductase domain-containing protein n=1 Tax=Mycolicibacterium fortuitum TaxID=1766 RepID=UPI0007EA12FC|nr:hypothetical protein A5669_04965 [Mycolicibacterium fortuitum]